MNGVARAVFALGSIFVVVVVAAALLLLRRARVALHVALAGAGAWGIAELLNEILGTHSIKGLGVNVRFGDGPTLSRRERRGDHRRHAGALAVHRAVAASGALRGDHPRRARDDVPRRRLSRPTCSAALLLGIAVGGARSRVCWDPRGRSFDRRGARCARRPRLRRGRRCSTPREQVARASVMDVELTSGEKLRVDAFGRDQRDAQLAAKLWRRMMYHEPGLQRVRHPTASRSSTSRTR